MKWLLAVAWAMLAALLIWRVAEHKAPAIQQDILARSLEAVKPINAKAEIVVDGRFVTLRGPERDAASKANTLAAARTVWGALGPNDGLWVTPVAKAVDYLLAEKRADGALLLTGSVPTAEAKASAEAAAKASFSGPVDNRLVISESGAASLTGLRDAFESLASLDFGSLFASAAGFHLSGSTDDPAKAEALANTGSQKWQVSIDGPDDDTIASDTPSSAHLMAVKAPDGAILVTGEVSSDEAHRALLAALKDEDGRLVDRLSIRSEGLPDGWGMRARAGADALVELDWGSLSLEGPKSYLSGMAPSDRIGAIGDSLGTGFTTELTPRPDDPDALRIAELQAQVDKTAGELNAANARMAELTTQLAAAPQQVASAESVAAVSNVAQSPRLAIPLPSEPPVEAPRTAALPPVSVAEEVDACNASMATILSRASITFETGKALITRQGNDVLDRLVAAASVCIGNPALKVTVGGHTDNQGRELDNFRLSQARAQAVKDALIVRSLAPETILAVGYGESQPIADNGTDDGKRLNRRITVAWSPK